MRAVWKTLTWRLVGSTSTFLISYLVTGQMFIATSIAVAQMIANTILYYIHERIWDRVRAE
jgi:uncharacterized membrane protein